MINDIDRNRAEEIKYETYLHVKEMRSGEEWVKNIGPKKLLNLQIRLKEWIKEEFCQDFRLDGEIMPRLEGDYYAQILTDNRQPHGCVCWTAGGFYLTATT